MIHWKLSALSLVLGGAATLGFVWLARPRRVPRQASPAELDEAARAELDEAAHADALHDLAAAGVNPSELDFAEPFEQGPVEVQSFRDESPGDDEHYDAVDPEDIGTEWLRRATEAPAIGPGEPESVASDLVESDVAEEVPVGVIDHEGNTELHPEERPTNVPVELPPNDEELARRAALDSSGDSGKAK